jgi:hypothetical protein
MTYHVNKAKHGIPKPRDGCYGTFQSNPYGCTVLAPVHVSLFSILFEMLAYSSNSLPFHDHVLPFPPQEAYNATMYKN